MEQKLIKDELDQREHNNRIRQNISMVDQYMDLNNTKTNEVLRDRNQDKERRRQMDEQIRQANFADAKLLTEKRKSLK
jgi:hypothetical protein